VPWRKEESADVFAAAAAELSRALRAATWLNLSAVYTATTTVSLLVTSALAAETKPALFPE